MRTYDKSIYIQLHRGATSNADRIEALRMKNEISCNPRADLRLVLVVIVNNVCSERQFVGILYDFIMACNQKRFELEVSLSFRRNVPLLSRLRISI